MAKGKEERVDFILQYSEFGGCPSMTGLLEGLVC